MRLHRKFHTQTDLPAVTCDFCDYFWKYDPQDPKRERRAKQFLNLHMNDEHPDKKMKCDQCDKTFWNNEQMAKHVKVHSFIHESGQLVCSECGYKCKDNHRLTSHINAVHLGIKPHLCDQCPMAFSAKGALKVHRMKHTGERSHFCQFCPKAFTSRHNLATHVRTHTGEKPHTCDVCGKSFNDAAYFAKHKRLHLKSDDGTQLKDFFCSICNKGFTRKSYLRNHMGTHNKLDKLSSPRTLVKYSNEFKSEAVTRAKEDGISKAARELEVNLNTLNGWVLLSENPHTCNICNKSFPYESSLKIHLKRHLENKNMEPKEYPLKSVTDPPKNRSGKYSSSFRKEVAEFAIANRIQDACKKYGLPHSTINFWVKLLNDPRSCPLCGKNFSNDNAVKRHLTQVHRENKSRVEINLEKSTDPHFLTSNFLSFNNLFTSEDNLKKHLEFQKKEKEEGQEMALTVPEEALQMNKNPLSVADYLQWHVNGSDNESEIGIKEEDIVEEIDPSSFLEGSPEIHEEPDVILNQTVP